MKPSGELFFGTNVIEENFVLRFKEREEAIYLITMGLKVCGKLLRTHRRGLGDDVEAFRDRCLIRLQRIYNF